MLRRLSIALLIALITAASAHAAGPFVVSVLQLIATPDRFDGKTVRVIGFLKLEFEGTALYFHRKDYDQAISKNAIWIDAVHRVADEWEPVAAFLGKDLSDQYVLIEGQFDASSHGHFGMFSGTITNVTRAERWISRSELEEKTNRQ